MSLVGQFGVDPLHIMVVHKIIELQPVGTVASHLIEPSHGVGDLEIVVVIVARIERLVKMVIGDRVKSALVDPPGIVAVDHFTHEPEIRSDLIGRLPKGLHISEIQHIGGIQTDPVDPEFSGPEADHITDIVSDSRIVLIQLRKKIISAPVVIGKSVVVFIIAPEIHMAVPVFVRRLVPILLNILKSKKVSSRVIENSIQDDPDSLSVAFLHKGCQVFVGSQTAVQLFVVRGLVTVAHGFKQRADIKGIAADVPDVCDPWQQSIEPVLRLSVRIGFRRPRQAQGINVIENGFVIPCHRSDPSLFCV